MEEMIVKRATPTIKCLILFLLIFTAKALTSRTQETHEESKNSIHQRNKPSQYVRTFTKYHHIRTNQWNTNHDVKNWQVKPDQQKVIKKRNVDIPNPSDYVERPANIPTLNQLPSDNGRGNIIESADKISTSKESLGSKNGLTSEMKKFKIKAAQVYKETTTTSDMPLMHCLYKIHSVVALSVTPSYDEDAQQVVVNEHFDAPGALSETTLPSGERVQVEQCTDHRATCYTLWHRDGDGNMTVLGQGCWRSAHSSCDRCTRVTPLLPGTKFCCCTRNLCNADFLSLREEIVTPKAVITIDSAHRDPNYSNIVAAAILALVAILVLAVAVKKMYCAASHTSKEDLSDSVDIEKGDVMGNGPDDLATGLLCVDNLTLIEHIGQGKFGSVWRGSLGATPVAVKIYSSASNWQREVSIYSMPHIAHPNLLKYYGSDSHPSLSGSRREHLVVLELCECTLRERLQQAPLTWPQFAELAHGLASALAHLHSTFPGKPCVVHRDVNSNNVLVRAGQARLADLGLAQSVARLPPAHIPEAGTLRYLAPEALEGALDLSGASAALCAVDVFALGLVLWEMLWRCSGARAGPAPPAQPPYRHLRLADRPTHAQMQNIVCRKKARPPLPRGPVPEARALRLACDTCEECWDHDAEARLTAVCVEERMAELKQILENSGPVIHDNNLHPHGNDTNSQPENEKNSNCLSGQTCDVNAPLLPPPLPPLPSRPHIGRNPCLERNTHHQHTHTVQLIHKSIKDIAQPHSDAPKTPNVTEQCISVARIPHNRPLMNENTERMNEIRSYQRPLDYVPNDVTVQDPRSPKQTNILQDVKVDKPKWDIRRFFQRRMNRNPRDTEVKLVPDVNGADSSRITTTVVDKPSNLPFRPSNITLNGDHNIYNTETPCLSPPNRTLSPTMILESDLNKENNVFGFKEIPSRHADEEIRPPNQIFAVIVPKGKPSEYKRSANLVERSAPKGSSESIAKNSVKTSMSAQSIFATGQSESEDSTIKKRLSCDNKIINPSNSGRSSRASINLELQYLDRNENFANGSPFEMNSDCSSSEDEQLMLLSEGSKITMQPVPKTDEKRKSDVLKDSTVSKTDFVFNKFHNKYTNFDNEYSDPNDKENLTFSGDNPVYLASLNGEFDAADMKLVTQPETGDKSPKPSLKNLAIKRQHSLEQVSEIFSSAGDIHLQNPAGRVKTPGDIPVAVRRARRDRALQKGRSNDSNRLSLYDDRMMFGNSL